jgi:hypothetical protein
MKVILIWIFTLLFLVGGVALFYYGIYHVLGYMGLFVSIALSAFWLVSIRL